MSLSNEIAFIAEISRGAFYIGNTKIDNIQELEVVDNTQSMEVPILGTQIRPLINAGNHTTSYFLSFSQAINTKEDYEKKIQNLAIQLNTFPIIPFYNVKLFELLHNKYTDLSKVNHVTIAKTIEGVIEDLNENINKFKEYEDLKNKENPTNVDKAKLEEFAGNALPTQPGMIPVSIDSYSITLNNKQQSIYTFQMIFTPFNYRPFMDGVLFAKTPATCLYKYLTGLVDVSSPTNNQIVKDIIKKEKSTISYTPIAAASQVYQDQIDYRKKRSNLATSVMVKTYESIDTNDYNSKHMRFGLNYHLYTIEDLELLVTTQLKRLTGLINSIDKEYVAIPEDYKAHWFRNTINKVTNNILLTQQAVDTLTKEVRFVKTYLQGLANKDESFGITPEIAFKTLFAKSTVIAPWLQRIPDNMEGIAQAAGLNRKLRVRNNGILSKVFTEKYNNIVFSLGFMGFPPGTSKDQNHVSSDYYRTKDLLVSYFSAMQLFLTGLVSKDQGVGVSKTDHTNTQVIPPIVFNPQPTSEDFAENLSIFSQIKEALNDLSSKNYKIPSFDMKKLDTSFVTYLKSKFSTDSFIGLLGHRQKSKESEEDLMPLPILLYGILSYTWDKAEIFQKNNTELYQSSTEFFNFIIATKKKIKKAGTVTSIKEIRENFINKIFRDCLTEYQISFDIFMQTVKVLLGRQKIKFDIDLYNNRMVPDSVVIQKEFSRPKINIAKFMEPTSQFMGSSNYKITMTFMCNDFYSLLRLKEISNLMELQKLLLQRRLAAANLVDPGLLSDRVKANRYSLFEDKISVDKAPLFSSLGINYIKINNFSVKTVPNKPDNYIVQLELIEDCELAPELESVYDTRVMTPAMKKAIFNISFPITPSSWLDYFNMLEGTDRYNYLSAISAIQPMTEIAYVNNIKEYKISEIDLKEFAIKLGKNTFWGDIWNTFRATMLHKGGTSGIAVHNLTTKAVVFNMKNYGFTQIPLPEEYLKNMDLNVTVAKEFAAILQLVFPDIYAITNKRHEHSWALYSMEYGKITTFWNALSTFIMLLNPKNKLSKTFVKNYPKRKITHNKDVVLQLQNGVQRFGQTWKQGKMKENMKTITKKYEGLVILWKLLEEAKQDDISIPKIALLTNINIRALLYLDSEDAIYLFLAAIEQEFNEKILYGKKAGGSFKIYAADIEIFYINMKIMLTTLTSSKERFKQILMMLFCYLNVHVLKASVLEAKGSVLTDLQRFNNASLNESASLLRSLSFGTKLLVNTVMTKVLLSGYTTLSTDLFIKYRDKYPAFKSLAKDYSKAIKEKLELSMGSPDDILFLLGKPAQKSINPMKIKKTPEKTYTLSSLIFIYGFRNYGYTTELIDQYQSEVQKVLIDNPYMDVYDALRGLNPPGTDTSGETRDDRLRNYDSDKVVYEILNAEAYAGTFVNEKQKAFIKAKKAIKKLRASTKGAITQEDTNKILKDLFKDLKVSPALQPTVKYPHMYDIGSGDKTEVEYDFDLKTLEDIELFFESYKFKNGIIGVPGAKIADPVSSKSICAGLLAQYLQAGPGAGRLYGMLNAKFRNTLKYGRLYEPMGGSYMKPVYAVYFSERDNPLFNNRTDFYRYFAISEIGFASSKEMASKTITIVASNVFMNLNNPGADREYENTDPFVIDTINENTLRTLNIKIGNRLVVKMGYYPDLRLAPVTFVGTISELNFQNGIVTIVAQSFGAHLQKIVKGGVLFKTNFLKSAYRSYGSVVIGLLDSITIPRELGMRRPEDWLLGAAEAALPVLDKVYDPNTGLVAKTTGIVGVVKSGAIEAMKRYTKKGKSPENIKAHLADRLLGRLVSNYTYNPRDDNIQLELSYDNPDLFNSKKRNGGRGFHFKWKTYGVSVWEAIKEVSLYTGKDTIVTTKIYYEGFPWQLDSIRETLYIGPKHGYYKATDSDIGYFGKLDVDTFIKGDKRLIAAPIDKTTGYPIVTIKLPKNLNFWELYNKNLQAFPQVSHLSPNFIGTRLAADGTQNAGLKEMVATRIIDSIASKGSWWPWSAFTKGFSRDKMPNLFKTYTKKMLYNPITLDAIEEFKSDLDTVSNKKIMNAFNAYFKNVGALLQSGKTFGQLQNAIAKLGPYTDGDKVLSDFYVSAVKAIGVKYPTLKKTKDAYVPFFTYILYAIYAVYMLRLSSTTYKILGKDNTNREVAFGPLNQFELIFLFILFGRKDNKVLGSELRSLKEIFKVHPSGEFWQRQRGNPSWFIGTWNDSFRFCLGHYHYADNLDATDYEGNINLSNVYDIVITDARSYLQNNNKVIKRDKQLDRWFAEMLKKEELSKILVELDTLVNTITGTFIAKDKSSGMPPHPQYLPISRIHYVDSNTIISNNIHVSGDLVINKVIVNYANDPAIYDLDKGKFKKTTEVVADPNIAPDNVRQQIFYANNIDYNKVAMLSFYSKLSRIEKLSKMSDEEIDPSMDKVYKRSRENFDAYLALIEKDAATEGAPSDISENWVIAKKKEAKKEEAANIKNIKKVINDIKESGDIIALLPRTNLIANRLLSEGLKRMYSGQLVILGRPDIEPYDVIILDDVINDIKGPFEVESIATKMDINGGFISVITPHAITAFRNTGYASELSEVANFYKTVDTIKNISIGVASGLAIGFTLGRINRWLGLAGAIVGGSTIGLLSAAQTRIARLGEALGICPIVLAPLTQYGAPITGGLEGATFTTFRASKYMEETGSAKLLGLTGIHGTTSDIT